MKKLFKLPLSILIIIVMLFGFVPTSVLAVSAEPNVIDVVVPAIWIPVDKDTNEVLDYLTPIPTIPDMYPRSEVAILNEDGTGDLYKPEHNGKHVIDYMGVPKPEPGAWSANRFMYTVNLFFRDKFHRVVAQGRDSNNFGELVSAIRKLEYGTFSDEAEKDTDSGKYIGLLGFEKAPYQEGETMKLYIATETEDTSLSEAVFGADEMDVIYYDDDMVRDILYGNIEEVKFNDFDNGAQIRTIDGVNNQDKLKERLDVIYLYKYDPNDNTKDEFIKDGEGYKDFNLEDNGFQGLAPGKYEVVFPIYWNRNVPEYMSAPDVFSRNRYQYDDTIHYTLNLSLPYTPETPVVEDVATVYDGEKHSITFDESFLDEGDIVEYSVDEGETWLIENPTFTDVGEYKVMIKVTNPDYEDRETTGKVTITQKPITIKVDNASKVFGEVDPEFKGTVTGLVKETDLGVVKFVRVGTEKAVGVYTAVLDSIYTENLNYKVTVEKGDFEITKVVVTEEDNKELGAEKPEEDHKELGAEKPKDASKLPATSISNDVFLYGTTFMIALSGLYITRRKRRK